VQLHFVPLVTNSTLVAALKPRKEKNKKSSPKKEENDVAHNQEEERMETVFHQQRL